MVMNNYDELLEQLKANEISEIEVSHEDFLTFRESWIKREDRMHFVGEAHLGGSITYRWQEEIA
ncbi:hypothetical protein CBF30_05420 [Vagococcus entomophilus]|uniref:Uncharacterized protein n=2 Tax=Vagococcus entomophilus TaxID=1160095 RepID=A0A430AKR2_9ENTE|nr:hypothetical protein CBF30_05420 [Vagococcus entomophilus]